MMNQSKNNSLTEVRVRYAETDQMGVVHHAVYPVWFEMARTDYIRQINITYAQMEEIGLLLPVHELSLKYLIPAKYDDILVIQTTIERVSASRIIFQYKLYNKFDSEKKSMVTGFSTHAWVGTDMKPLNVKKCFPEVFEKITNLLSK